MTEQKPPTAEPKPHFLTLHGHTRQDNYFWLRERTHPDMLAYLAAENDYTAAAMAHTKPLQKKIYAEMVDHIQETDSTAPIAHGGYFYYSRTEAGKEYSIYCRRQGSLDAPEEILIDLNVLAEGHSFLRLGIYEISPNHNLLAYSLDTNGSEHFTIHFKNLVSGETLPDQIPSTIYDGQWANDNRTFFYTTHDDAWRSDKLHRHTIGSDTSQDELLFHEPDALYSVHLTKTKDQAYLVLNVGGIETSEAYVLDANKPHGPFQLIHPRQHGVRYQVHHHNGTFYILTNEEAPNYKVLTAPVANPAKTNWQLYIPHRPQVLLGDLELFGQHLVVYERENGLQTMRVIHLASGTSHPITFPEPVYSYEQGKNPEFNATTLRFVYRSLTTPDSDFDYDMVTGTRTLVKQKPVLGGYDLANYQTERLFAPADDGTLVPLSLVYRRGSLDNGRCPTLLYGYGSYGASIDPLFDANRLSLLDRGFIFALAHIRGGQEMGRYWYDQGKFLHKKNTFTDFIACARHLIATGYTSANKLCILGRSAGGLLMGAVLNMAPELFHAAIAGVPFVDVISTMLDETIPLTVGEFEEWGNPQNKEFYDYMLSYSPYDNVTAQDYPHILATAGLNDPRVQYWEPAKWVAKLRTQKTDPHRLLLKTNMGAGHFSASGRYAYLEDMAFQYAFLLDSLGIQA